MTRYSRLFIALLILLSGVALTPRVGIFAGVVSWQRFANGYEDQVTVLTATYKEGSLAITAVNTADDRATLSVYRAGGAPDDYIGDLVYNPVDDQHTGVFNVGENPGSITVRSSLGGEDTVIVNDDNDPGVELYMPLILVEGDEAP